MKLQNIFWSAAVLLVCNFISRLLGFAYRIVLVRLLGTEGIGITEMVSPIYTFALVAAGLGIPLAMSQLLAIEQGRHNYHNLPRIQRGGMTLLIGLGTAVSLACFILAPQLIEHFSGEERGLNYLRIICPAIFLVTVCSGLRAYFQGTKQIYIIGLAQNLEQVVRVGSGAALVMLALPHGLEAAVSAVAVATVLGELCGLLFILHQYRRQCITPDRPPDIGRRRMLGHFFGFGMPVTLQRLLSSAILMLQAMLIPQTLQQMGYTAAQAASAYGNFSGVALSLIHLPGIFTATLVMALLPSIAESGGDTLQLSRRIDQSLHITAVIALPFMLLFHQYAEPLCRWLFKAPEAAASLRILALATFFIYMQTALDGILQGMGRVKSLLVILGLSGLIYISALQLCIPRLGPSGAAAAYLIFAISGCLLALIMLRRSARVHLEWSNILLKPALAAVICFAIQKAADTVMSAADYAEITIFLFAAGLSGLAYLTALHLMHGLPAIFLHYIRPFRRLLR